MKYFDLYGYSGGTGLEAARWAAEKSRGHAFNAHEGSYHCGDFYRNGVSGSEHFVLQRNYDDLEKEWSEGRFKEHPVLLYVNESQRAQEFQSALTTAGFSLLRREAL